jgi:hypothetical protein
MNVVCRHSHYYSLALDSDCVFKSVRGPRCQRVALCAGDAIRRPGSKQCDVHRRGGQAAYTYRNTRHSYTENITYPLLTVFWVVTTSSLVQLCQRFGRTYFLHLPSMRPTSNTKTVGCHYGKSGTTLPTFRTNIFLTPPKHETYLKH